MSQPPDPRASATKCRACGALVVWARHAVAGSVEAIDVEPHADGRFMLWRELGRWKYGKAPQRDTGQIPLHCTHQQTCPDPTYRGLRQIRHGDPGYAPLTTPMRPAHTGPMKRPTPQEELPL